MPLISKLARRIDGGEYPFQKRDFPTTLIEAVDGCGCAKGEHSFTTIAITETDTATLERRKCVCSGCHECEVCEVRVMPHAPSDGRRHVEPFGTARNAG
ncbi:hypothetical protein GCM10010174_89580 [Kutzneria viridogrisea]|uniref:Uncharacterized protein n=2 Tax=Kutzneria TaxID=43356 RepID=W5WLE8_9PSEU|nr:hypothetical protein [Kutzneria albida]AHI02049.1 hypothetical protein KALB_8692 [Kutzneria albida DSM 43870]MBA8929390.1 hypothetical protein [Kutzneria viridogrisea]